MVAAGDFDELYRHTQAIVRFSNAALEQRPDRELAADLANVRAGAAKLKGSGPGRDPKTIHVRKGVDQFLRETFTEVILVTTGAHIRERKNGDGGNVGRWRRQLGNVVGRRLGEPRDESVPAAMPGLDEARLLRVILERPAQLLDAGGEGVVADDGVFPDRREQVLLGDRLSGARHELFQHRSRLQRQADLPRAGPETPGFDVEPITAEAHPLLHRAPSGAPSRQGHDNPGEIPARSRDSGPCRPVSF